MSKTKGFQSLTWVINDDDIDLKLMEIAITMSCKSSMSYEHELENR